MPFDFSRLLYGKKNGHKIATAGIKFGVKKGYFGNVDAIGESTGIRGWVLDAALPSKPQTVLIMLGRNLLGTAVASESREDVSHLFGREATCAFHLDWAQAVQVPEEQIGQSDTLTFLIIETDIYLEAPMPSPSSSDIVVWIRRAQEAQKIPRTPVESALRTNTASFEHPYKAAQSHQVWNKAFGLNEFESNNFVTRAKFKIGDADRIATAGSCFAQHIGRYLSDAGIVITYGEKPEPPIDKDSEEYKSYFVYSGRYGNIYTVHQFSDLLDQAFGNRPVIYDFHVDNNFGCDLLRPAVVNGRFTLPELEILREQHIQAMNGLFTNIDVLIFTLGLTEAWINYESGYTYPVCPGTRGGKFDATRHTFKNYSFFEIYEKAQSAFAFLKTLNPNLKIILTVSPVALAATYTTNHVAVANCHSKSVLRTVASALAASADYIDYFPSYDILTSPAALGRYQARNLREVNQSGVELAMTNFLANYLNSTGTKISLRDAHAPESLYRDPDCDELFYGKIASG